MPSFLLPIYGLLAARAAGSSWSWLTGIDDSPTPSPSGGGVDMSAVFARFTDCGSCIDAGYGWCPNRRKCGGFANRQCGEGERYRAIGTGPSPPKAKPASSAGPSPPRATASGGMDMRATFAKLRTCTECVAAGYGWCTIQRKCGGFANNQCGEGERYRAEGAAPAREPLPSGLWTPKRKREAQADADAPMEVVSMPPVEASPEATVLHAGPVRAAAAASAKSAKQPEQVVSVSVDAGSGGARRAPLERAQLAALSHGELVERVLALQHDLAIA